jgi:hypothetical protein
MISLAVLATAILAGPAAAQTFRRAAACPNLGCIYPPVSVSSITPRLKADVLGPS